MSGQVRQGEFLRLERLAADLGISVTPVREALQLLRSEGFVQLEPRRGFVVAPLARQDIEDLFWAQATIAAELAVRAASKITPETVMELEATQRAMARSVHHDDTDRVEELNHRFHRSINLSSGSKKLAWVLGAVTRYTPAGIYGRITGWPDAALRDHEEILDAIRRGDPQAAGTAMRTHIDNAGKMLMSHLEDQGLWE